jgi:hypothetical protein
LVHISEDSLGVALILLGVGIFSIFITMPFGLFGYWTVLMIIIAGIIAGFLISEGLRLIINIHLTAYMDKVLEEGTE